MTLSDLEIMFMNLENILDFFEKDGQPAFDKDQPIGIAYAVADIEGVKTLLNKHKEKLSRTINGVRRRDLIKL